MATSALNWSLLARQGGWLHPSNLLDWQKSILTEMKRRSPKEGGLIWILSSGTQATDEVKTLGLKAEAFEVSATSVNKHLNCVPADRWLLALPVFHVGGLGVVIRATLSGSSVSVLPRWNPSAFVSLARSRRCTLSSLVPTQIYDLVVAGLTSPESLRAVVIGGGALDEDLYLRARALGWPLLPSYGLTECASQVATATLGSLRGKSLPELRLLSHVDARVGAGGRLELRSPSLCHLIARGRKDGGFTLEDPLRKGWLQTEDLGEILGSALKVFGRDDDVVKVLGELVPLAQVESLARKHFLGLGLVGEVSVLAVKGGREGMRLILVTDTGGSLREWSQGMDDLNSQMPGPMRLRQLAWVVQIPRGELGKVKKAALRTFIGL